MTNSSEVERTDSSNQIQQDSQGSQNQIIGQAVSSTIVNVTAGGQVTIYQSQLERTVEAEPLTVSVNIGPNPYKGLLAFQETDGDRFFGRDEQIAQLWQKFHQLHQVESAIRVLPIYGPSGSGKSSLARAGLIPELARRPLSGRERAQVAVLVPGTHPLTALATVLARVATNDPTPVEKSEEFERVLKKPSDTGEYEGLRRIADVLPDIALSPLIVLVDQFEEVYTLCEDQIERDAFVGNLLHAANDRAGRVSVILTLRSDFLGETQKHPVLNGLFAEQGFLVRSMTQIELREAIAEPAKQAGHPLDNATIDLLIKDTEGREGALPLLQFALTRIWEGLAQGKEPAETLKAIGGVGGALAGEAQHIYDSLNSTEQDIARRVFLGLVQLGEGTKDTRRRAELGQVVSYRDNPEQVKRVIARFSGAGARLITLAATANDKTETAEVTHEALLEHWQQFKEWVERSRSDLRFQRRLDEAATYWDEHGRPDGNLWRFPDLDLLRRYQERAGDNMTPLQMQFFEASRSAEEKQQEQAEQQRLKEQQQQRFQKQAIRGLAILSIGSVGLATFALYQLQQGQRQRVEQLAVTSKALTFSQPADAVINAIAAVGLGQSSFVRFLNAPITLTAYTSLLDAIQLNREQNLLHHTDVIFSVAFSPDGKRIVLGSKDNMIRLWDATTGKPIGTPLKGHKAEVMSVAFSPEGKRIVSGSRDSTVRLWDATTGKQIGTPLKGHEHPIASVAFSPDGKRIVSNSADNTLQLWDATTGKPIGDPLKGHEDVVYSVAFSPDGKRIVSGSWDNSVRLWNATTGRLIGDPLKGHEHRVLSVAFSPDGKQIVSGSYDKTVRLWDAMTGKQIGVPLKGHERAIWSVAFSPDGRRIVSGSVDKTVRLWDVTTGQPIGAPLKGHEDVITSVTFSPDGKRIASGSGDRTVRLWNATTDNLIGFPLKGHEDGIDSVAFSPDGKRIVSGSVDKTLRLWNTMTGQPIGVPLKGHENGIASVTFSPDGKWIASGSWDSTVRVWDATTSKPIGIPLKGHEESVLSVAFSPDGKRILSGSKDNMVRLWDAMSGKLLRILLKGQKDGVESLAFSLDGKQIVLGSYDGEIQLWDVTTDELIKSIGVAVKGHEGRIFLKGHEDRVLSVAFSPDGKRIVSGSWDNTMRLWDITTGKTVGISLKGHEDRVLSVAFSPDGKQIVSGSYDRTIRLWDATTGQPIGIPLKGHEDAILSVAFSPDGKWIVSGSADSTVRLWSIDQALSWEGSLKTACDQLQYHSRLTEPSTETAKVAKQTCEQYAWK